MRLGPLLLISLPACDARRAAKRDLLRRAAGNVGVEIHAKRGIFD
jgi:hypothetical protein